MWGNGGYNSGYNRFTRGVGAAYGLYNMGRGLYNTFAGGNQRSQYTSRYPRYPSQMQAGAYSNYGGYKPKYNKDYKNRQGKKTYRKGAKRYVKKTDIREIIRKEVYNNVAQKSGYVGSVTKQLTTAVDTAKLEVLASIGNAADLELYLNTLVPAAANITTNVKFNIHKMEENFTITNSHTAGVEITLYYCLARKNTSSAVSVSSLLSDGFLANVASTSTLNASVYATDPSVQPYKSVDFVNKFKIYKQKKMVLKSGESINFTCKCTGDKQIRRSDYAHATSNSTYTLDTDMIGGWSKCLLIKHIGLVGHDFTTQATTGTAATCLDVKVIINIEGSYVQDLSNNLSVGAQVGLGLTNEMVYGEFAEQKEPVN